MTRPELEALVDAARVVDFYEEREFGRWRSRRFEVTEEDFTIEIIRAQVGETSVVRRAKAVSRVVPPGEYVTLQRRMTEEEIVSVLIENDFDPDSEVARKYLPPDRQWMPVMSDTPAEIAGAAPALLHATGRVLITGLGLGCVPHALLTKPDVTHIDIIEIDPDVIELSSAYLTDPRVHIHRGSALNVRELFDTRFALYWDYAWHDIWTNISASNLTDEKAEHGISYERLFELYEPFVKVQDAWAYGEAQEMQAIQEQEATDELEFQAKVRAMPLDEAVEMVYERALRDRLVGPGFEEIELTDEVRAMLDPKGGLKDHIRSRLSDPDMWEKYQRDVAEREARERPSRPNAHLEEA